MTQHDLARELHSSQQAVSRWARGDREPRGTSWELLRALAVRQGLLKDNAEEDVIPIMGYIGAGAEIDTAFEQVPPEGLDQVEAPLRFDFAVMGFRVKGSSMEPVYHDGDVVVVRADRPKAVESLTGEEAAIRTDDGRRLLKHIMPGSKQHRYDLISTNAEAIRDVGIAWASEVVATVRASQAKLKGRRKRPTLEYQVTVGKGERE